MLYSHKKTYSLYEVQGMSKRTINKHFRTTDDSKLWPICGKFNATERAIRRVRRFQAQTGTSIEGLEYWLALESELSNIVNGVI